MTSELAVEGSTRSVTGTPMLPPTRVWRPACWKMWPMRAVVVVLPLAPVMAVTWPASSSAASSSSPMTRAPRARARSKMASSRGTPGDWMRRGEAVGIGLVLGGLGELGLGLGFGVGDRHVGAAGAEIARGGEAGFTGADDEGFLVAIVGHRSFRVVSAKRAMMRPMIQKRVMTLASCQPRSSK